MIATAERYTIKGFDGPTIRFTSEAQNEAHYTHCAPRLGDARTPESEGRGVC